MLAMTTATSNKREQCRPLGEFEMKLMRAVSEQGLRVGV